MSMSGGLWSYNRFEQYEAKLRAEAAKPDYLDFDKDGDKKEPMKKALKEKGKKTVSEKKELPDFIQKKIDEKEGKKSDDKDDDKKKSKKDDCECKEEVELEEGSCGGGYQKGGMVGYQKGGEVKPKKKITKEDVLDYMVSNNLANNVVSAEVIFEHVSDEFLISIEEDIEKGL